MPTIAIRSFISLIVKNLEDDSHRRSAHDVDDPSLPLGARRTGRKAQKSPAVAVAEYEESPDHVVRRRSPPAVLVHVGQGLDPLLDDPVPLYEGALHLFAPERLRGGGPQVDGRSPSRPSLLDHQLLARPAGDRRR